MQPLEVLEGFNKIPKDTKVWNWVYGTYFPQILNTVRKTTGGSPYSEDITTDVFVVLWQETGPFITVPGILEFLNTVAVRKSLNENRKQDTAERHAEGVRRYYLNIEERNRENAEIDDHYNHLMYVDVEKLPRVRKLVFKLSYFEKLTNEQIALKQGISKRTVETHMTQAYRFLRIEVKKSGGYFTFTLFFVL